MTLDSRSMTPGFEFLTGKPHASVLHRIAMAADVCSVAPEQADELLFWLLTGLDPAGASDPDGPEELPSLSHPPSKWAALTFVVRHAKLADRLGTTGRPAATMRELQAWVTEEALTPLPVRGIRSLEAMWSSLEDLTRRSGDFGDLQKRFHTQGTGP